MMWDTAPFLTPEKTCFRSARDQKKRYVHEEYSAAIIRHLLKDAIENHPLNGNCDFKADDVASLIEGSSKSERRIFWRDIISGQMDADRMDYLLRDSLHAGVDYGKYDWRRLLNTVVAVRISEHDGEESSNGLRLGVTEGGIHAAEALVLARYFMFTQVYFHKTRVAYDHHLRQALAAILEAQVFPAPEPDTLAAFVAWDDWKVLGRLADGAGGPHGARLKTRDHYREIYHTPECPDPSDLVLLSRVEEVVKEYVVAREEAGKSWYKVDRTDIPVVSDVDGGRILPLSKLSPVVQSLRPTRRISLYAEREKVEKARELVVRELDLRGRSAEIHNWVI